MTITKISEEKVMLTQFKTICFVGSRLPEKIRAGNFCFCKM